MVIYTLYQYANRLNGKKYIGVTSDLKVRHRHHSNGTSNASAFNAAVKKYGMSAFDLRTLAVFDNADAAAYHEQALIARCSLSPVGYNLRAGAPFTRYSGPHTAETRQKMMGRPFTDKMRAALQEANIGRPFSDDHRNNLSAARMGNQNAVGYNHTDEWRANRSAAMMGHSTSAETRVKLSRPKSDEYRAKMSESKKLWWARRRFERIWLEPT